MVLFLIYSPYSALSGPFGLVLSLLPLFVHPLVVPLCLFDNLVLFSLSYRRVLCFMLSAIVCT